MPYKGLVKNEKMHLEMLSINHWFLNYYQGRCICQFGTLELRSALQCASNSRKTELCIVSIWEDLWYMQCWIITAQLWNECQFNDTACGKSLHFFSLSESLHCYKNASKIPLKFREGADAMCIGSHNFATASLWSRAKLLQSSQWFGVTNCTVCTH